MAVEVLDVRIAAQSEFVFSEAQSLQQDAVVESLRALKIGHCDVDMVDSNNFGHGDGAGVGGLTFEVRGAPLAARPSGTKWSEA